MVNASRKKKAWSYDMEGHARDRVERYCELGTKDRATFQGFQSVLGRSPNEKG